MVVVVVEIDVGGGKAWLDDDEGGGRVGRIDGREGKRLSKGVLDEGGGGKSLFFEDVMLRL